jgi:hypothetical protein
VEKYSDEEFKALNYDQIDPLRVPDSMRYVYEVARDKAKNLEKAYNEKYMSLAEERKKLETSAIEQFPQSPEEKEQWLIKQYDKNPQLTLNDLDTSILSLKNQLEMLKIDVMTNPFAEDIEEKKKNLFQQQQSVIELERYQRKLGQYISNKGNYDRMQQEIAKAETVVATEVINDIRKDFPEFDKKRDELTDFATKKLGFSSEQIYNLTNPVRISLSNRIPLEDAKKMAKNVYNTVFKLYNYEKMISDGKNKIKQTPPPQLTKAGSPKASASETDLDSYDALDKYLTAKGV